MRWWWCQGCFDHLGEIRRQRFGEDGTTILSPGCVEARDELFRAELDLVLLVELEVHAAIAEPHGRAAHDAMVASP